ncbi:MAG: hypothetical protein LC732_06490, partial [Acidobacteria bacterium]|nr:hypothetical protein [Acidobacteriota bacterium]
TPGLAFSYDPLGNLVGLRRAATPDDPGTALLTGSFRGAGRADVRTIHTVCEPGAPMCAPAQIVKSYGYHVQTGQLTRAAVSVNGLTIAGSEVTHDGLQVDSARMLGMSSEERRSHFRYDARGRLAASLFATLGDAPVALDPMPGRAKEELTPADFRTAQERLPHLDAATQNVLAAAGIDPQSVEPPTVTATESAKGHKTEQLCRGTDCEQIGWTGGERTEDGRFYYEWDDRGRLIRVIEKPTTPGLTIRRIVYAYSGADRLVGRTAQYAIAFDAPALPLEADWKLEDRPVVLESDRLPAETTFAWDPVTDQLVAAFRAGATTTMPHAGLVRQILHGGYAYDDPIEVTVFRDGSVPGDLPIEHLYPLYDEAAGGTLQAILGSAGEIKLRSVANDPYGAEQVELAGAMVDRMTVGATKDASGAISQVRVTIGLTEAIAESTVAAGVRLATVDAAGKVVRLATVAPALLPNDPFRIEWVLDGAQWQALLAPATSGATAHSLSIAVTSELRAVAWAAEVPVLSAPDWIVATQSVSSSADRPVEVEESIASLTSWIVSLGTGTTSERRILELGPTHAGGGEAAGGVVDALLVSEFHAGPFEEVLTGHVNFRARWVDGQASSFLSPDPLGYVDSANSYAFASGNPIGGVDPTGERIRVRGSAAEQNQMLDYLRRIVGVADPEAAEHIGIIDGHVEIVGMSAATFKQRFQNFAQLLLEMVEHPDTLVLGFHGRGHRGEQITRTRTSPYFNYPVVDLGDKGWAKETGGGEVFRVLKDEKMGIDWFESGRDADSARAGVVYALFDPAVLPREVHGVLQTAETMMTHELFGHGYDALIGWSDQIDYGQLRYPKEFRALSKVNAEMELVGLWVENQYRKRAGMPRRMWYREEGDFRPAGPSQEEHQIQTAFGRAKRRQ